MSEVIATILLLGMTVTLFSAVFIMVNRFPTPQPQAQTQFETTLLTSGSGSSETVSGIAITHGTGPDVPLNAKVYLQSSDTSATNWQLAKAGGIPVSWGLATNGTGSLWGAGEIWTSTFNPGLSMPVSVTVTIVTPSVVLYQAVIPSSSVSVPPLVVATGTTPTPVQQGSTFQIYAVLSGDTTGVKGNITVLLSALSGLSAPSCTLGTTHTCPLTYSTTSGDWTTPTITTTSSTTPGTYTAFITGKNSAGQTFSGSVTIEVA